MLEAAGCDVITVALRRIDFDRPDESILNYIPEGKILLPNTSEPAMLRKQSGSPVLHRPWDVVTG